MLSRPQETFARFAFRLIGWLAVGCIALWIVCACAWRWDRQILSLEDFRARLLLTSIGIATSAFVARWLVYAARVFFLPAMLGLVCFLVSIISYNLLVWTEWKISPMLWRVWWISTIGMYAIALATAIRLPASGRRGFIERAAAFSLSLLAILLACLAFRSDILATPTPLFAVVALVLFSVVATGGLIARLRFRRGRPPKRMRRWQRIAWVVTGQAALVAIGFYAGRVTQPAPSIMKTWRSELTGQSDIEIEQRVRTDLHRLQRIEAGIQDLRVRADALRAQLAEARARDGRQYFTPAEADQMQPIFVGYLACRDALLRIVATYSGFAHVRDPDVKARCFLAGFGAGSTLYASSLRTVAYGDDPIIRRQLNEAEPAWDLPAGSFDDIYRAVTEEQSVRLYEEMAAYYMANRESWKQNGILGPESTQWLYPHIDAAMQSVRVLDIDRDQTRWELLAARVRADAYSPLYSMQSVVSTWVGDTRLVARPSFVSEAQIKSMQPRLRPGDILLERRNWFASNAFLPGFWPHAALYVGTPDDLEKLHVIRHAAAGWESDDPAVNAKLGTYLVQAVDGEPNTVIEAVSEGVIFNSLTHSMAADYIAVLRPRRLNDEQRATVIRRAFANAGKPYDFEFDFGTADKLVCTELVYRSFGNLIDFDCDPGRPGTQLPEIMGRSALPALEFCRKFARERSRADREFDLVFFLDAAPAQRTAREASEDAFCASADRPRGFNE